MLGVKCLSKRKTHQRFALSQGGPQGCTEGKENAPAVAGRRGIIVRHSSLARVGCRHRVSNLLTGAVRPQRQMAKPTIIVKPTAPRGFRWEIIADGQTLKSGTTATEFEARTMAEAELKELEKDAGPP